MTFTIKVNHFLPKQHIQCSCRNNSLGGRSKKRFELSALGTAEHTLKGAPEVGVEHVVDNGVNHGPAVGQPLESCDDGWCHIPATGDARATQQVGGEEGQVEHDEGGEQNTDDLHGPSTLGCSRRRGTLSATHHCTWSRLESSGEAVDAVVCRCHCLRHCL
jgi:hypothetical protein